MTGRVVFLSALAYVAFRYIARSNKKHQGITARVGTTEVLPPVKESAAVAPATEAPSLTVTRSIAAEPDPQS
ncbi:MAG TPA: hypothetical protein VEQ63_12860 [Bryobacteraceae bacterium]|nr:hypothetical protein [Bryobacteraceae bacterium]